MEDNEEWDDLQDAEMEASGNLETLIRGEANGDVHVINDDDDGDDETPVALKKRNFVELDSSSDSDSNSGVRKRKDSVNTPSSCSDWRRSCGFGQSSGKCSSGSLVRTAFS